MKDIYKIMGKALANAKASQRQAHLAFLMLEIKGVSCALNYVNQIKEKNKIKKLKNL